MPARNEARRLPASLSRCAEFFHQRLVAAEIVVADDGSTDGTRRVVGDSARELGSGHLTIRYLPLPRRGKGAAVKAGMLAAQGDPVVHLDVDLAARVEIVDAFVSAIRDGADVAVARATGFAGVGRGAMACTAEAARSLFSRQTIDGRAFDAEVLLVARRLGYRVVEVAASPGERRSVAALAQIPSTARDLLWIRWRALRGAYERE